MTLIIIVSENKGSLFLSKMHNTNQRSIKLKQDCWHLQFQKDSSSCTSKSKKKNNKNKKVKKNYGNVLCKFSHVHIPFYANQGVKTKVGDNGLTISFFSFA